jgi:hypothetical protein
VRVGILLTRDRGGLMEYTIDTWERRFDGVYYWHVRGEVWWSILLTRERGGLMEYTIDTWERRFDGVYYWHVRGEVWWSILLTRERGGLMEYTIDTWEGGFDGVRVVPRFNFRCCMPCGQCCLCHWIVHVWLPLLFLKRLVWNEVKNIRCTHLLQWCIMHMRKLVYAVEIN